ncbi:MAG: hypothetical protein RXS23_10010 [Metallosphaera yellowstonensis]|uniref:hypothetical protein n=1 Tax=Metallosphaera yellowstonensis TaxID=1111107 RepID=UPI0012DECEDC|nr:hypothetical protein [Metallosphaera yellowstonensis]
MESLEPDGTGLTPLPSLPSGHSPHRPESLYFIKNVINEYKNIFVNVEKDSAFSATKPMRSKIPSTK